jgi:hypothetical protein
LIILDGQTIVDAVTSLLKARQSALRDIYTFHLDNPEKPLADYFRGTTDILKGTLYNVSSIFCGSANENDERMEDKSLMELYLSRLEKGLSVGEVSQETPLTVLAESVNGTEKAFLTGLYNSSKTNTHLIFQYLPESITSFVPYINKTKGTDGGVAKQLEDYAIDCVLKWIEDIVPMVHSQSAELLKLAVNGRVLWNTRDAVCDYLQNDEERKEDGHVSQWRGVSFAV